MSSNIFCLKQKDIWFKTMNDKRRANPPSENLEPGSGWHLFIIFLETDKLIIMTKKKSLLAKSLKSKHS